MSTHGSTYLRMKVPLALSGEERRRLEKLERELAAAHPDLDREFQSAFTRKRTTGPIVYGILAALAGLGVVIAGAAMRLTILGLVGFLVMVAGGHLFLNGICPGRGVGKPW